VELVIIGLLVLVIVLLIILLLRRGDEVAITERLGKLEVNMMKSM